MTNNKVLKILNDLNLNGFNQKYGTDKASDHSYDLFYDKEFEHSIYLPRVLEIGTYRGGSILLWSDLLHPSSFLSIDKEDNIDDEFKDYLKKELYLCRYHFLNDDAYNLSETNLKFLNFLAPFDYIFEDGSHDLNDQLFVVKEYSKLLSQKGAALYIEDVQSIENAYSLERTFNDDELLKRNYRFTIHDFRHIKNRWDDIIVKIEKIYDKNY